VLGWHGQFCCPRRYDAFCPSPEDEFMRQSPSFGKLAEQVDLSYSIIMAIAPMNIATLYEHQANLLVWTI